MLYFFNTSCHAQRQGLIAHATHTRNRQELSLVWTCGNVGRSTWPGRVGDPVRGRAKCDPVRGRAKCDPVRGRAKCDPVRGRAKCDPVCSRLAEGNIYDCRLDSKVAERQRERDGRPGTEYERGECPIPFFLFCFFCEFYVIHEEL